MRESLLVSIGIGAALFGVVSLTLTVVLFSAQYPLIVAAAAGAGIGGFGFALATEYWTRRRE